MGEKTGGNETMVQAGFLRYRARQQCVTHGRKNQREGLREVTRKESNTLLGMGECHEMSNVS